MFHFEEATVWGQMDEGVYEEQTRDSGQRVAFSRAKAIKGWNYGSGSREGIGEIGDVC